MTNKQGKVIILGAGPGDPGLLTLKGKEWIEKADVIIYDYLANERFLDFTRVNTEKIFVGKKKGDHTLSQEQINELMLKRAKEGNLVVRLKGGDPFIFGRGGEEAEELVNAGIAFEIVPGVTAATSVPAYAGIPLTHRNFTSTIAFVTGHENPEKEHSEIAWDKISTGIGTLVFLMGVINLPNIVNTLINNGRDKSTPVGIIRWGTTHKQETIIGTLENIVELAKKRKIKPPSIIVVGDVVRLNKKLNWFETKPLFKKQIIVTRAHDQASNFSKLLEKKGACPVEFPTIETVPPDSWEALDKAIENIEMYDWLIFTSANGVKNFLLRIKENQKDVRCLKGIKLCAIGPKTAEVLEKFDLRIDFVPAEYKAEAIIEGLGSNEVRGKKILIPRAAVAREVLPEELVKLGATVDVVDAYKTIQPKGKTGEIREMLKNKEVGVITFTSSSTVTNFISMFKKEEISNLVNGVTIACIGPITAETAEKNGLNVSIIPANYTIEAFTDAIVDFYQHRRMPVDGG
tara:strand:+ start:12848 stop:14398 length:1551 start_codon:yes stop_codon:yes gene_type:complete